MVVHTCTWIATQFRWHLLVRRWFGSHQVAFTASSHQSLSNYQHVRAIPCRVLSGLLGGFDQTWRFGHLSKLSLSFFPKFTLQRTPVQISRYCFSLIKFIVSCPEECLVVTIKAVQDFLDRSIRLRHNNETKDEERSRLRNTHHAVAVGQRCRIEVLLASAWDWSSASLITSHASQKWSFQ